MSETGKRLEQLGIQLPVRNRKGQGVVDAVIEDGMMYLSAHLPWIWREARGTPGKVGADVDLETAYQAARLCGLNAWYHQGLRGELDRVDHVVKVLGLVNSAGDFSSQPAVINGFSDLMVEVFGRRGQHARSAMGAFALPMNVPVVVEMIAKLR